MERHLWKEPMTETHLPPWQCPVCKVGKFQMIQKSVREEETATSKRWHHEEDWDPSWNQYVFTAWGQCNNKGCLQHVAISGTGGVSDRYCDDEGNVEQFSTYQPLSCHPMPRIIALPEKCPKTVSDELDAAFKTFFSDTAATANHIRTAIEHFLTFLGVRKKRKTKKNKFHTLDLHARIVEFEATSPTYAKQLMAIKWLGNSGSHGKPVEKDDLLTAFAIIEHFLDELINKSSLNFAKMAKSLLKRHKRRP